MRLPRPVLSGVLVAIAAATWWLAERGTVEEARQVTPPGHVPEQYAKNLRTTDMDVRGRPARSLETPRLTRLMARLRLGSNNPLLS